MFISDLDKSAAQSFANLFGCKVTGAGERFRPGVVEARKLPALKIAHKQVAIANMEEELRHLPETTAEGSGSLAAIGGAAPVRFWTKEHRNGC